VADVRLGSDALRYDKAMDFLKSTAGKVIAGLVALGVIAAAISWWRMDEATRAGVVGGGGKILGWLGIVLVLPWVGFPLIARVGRMDSNLAGGLLVVGLTGVEVLFLAWLFGFAISGATAWTFFILGALSAGVYNLFTCDWLAEKLA
jgi:hypothetical protein